METMEYDGDIKPSSEKKLHREVYRLKPEAKTSVPAVALYEPRKANTEKYVSAGIRKKVFSGIWKCFIIEE